MSVTPAEEAQVRVQAGGGALLPIGTAGTPFAQTFDRRLASGTVFAPTTQVLTLTAIELPAGKVVTGISFVSGSTAESGGSHLWFALYDRNLNLLAQGTDETGAAAFAANSVHRQALTAPQTCLYSGLYYLGFCATASGMPTLLCSVVATVNATGNITGMTPIVAGTSTGSLGASAPNPAAALTAITQAIYAFVD